MKEISVVGPFVGLFEKRIISAVIVIISKKGTETVTSYNEIMNNLHKKLLL